MSRENTPHDIFVDLDTESDADCVRDARTTKPWVSLLEFDDGIDEILRGTLRAWPLVALLEKRVLEQATVFPVDKCSMKP